MASELNIFGTIGGWDASETKETVKEKLDFAAGQEVTINISSSGGNIFEGLSIAGMIADYRGNTIAKGIGIVASAATIILLKAKVKKMVKNSFFMLHNSWGGAEGNAEELEKSVELLKKIDNDMCRIYTDQIQSNGKLIEGSYEKTFAKVKKMMHAETWLTAEEAEELGLIDEVINTDQYKETQMSAFAQVKKSKFKNIPKNLMMANEKKTLLQQIAALFGISAEFKPEEETQEPEATPAAASENSGEGNVEDSAKTEKTEAEKKQEELEQKLAAAQIALGEKQKQLEEIEAKIQAKINYKTEPKTEQAPQVGFDKEQLAQASAFMDYLIKKH